MSLKEKIQGEAQKEKGGFVYDPSSIRDLSGSDGIDSAAEKFLREVREIAADEVICARCLENSNKRISVKGKKFCPLCGTGQV